MCSRRSAEMDFNYIKQSCEEESLVGAGAITRYYCRQYQSGASLRRANDHTRRQRARAARSLAPAAPRAAAPARPPARPRRFIYQLMLVTNLYINTPVMKTHLDPIQQTSKSIKRGLSTWLRLRKIMINKRQTFSLCRCLPNKSLKYKCFHLKSLVH